MNNLELSCKLGPNEIDITIDPKAKHLCTVVENKAHYTVAHQDLPPLLAAVGMIMQVFDRLPKRDVKGFQGTEIPDALPEEL